MVLILDSLRAGIPDLDYNDGQQDRLTVAK